MGLVCVSQDRIEPTLSTCVDARASCARSYVVPTRHESDEVLGPQCFDMSASEKKTEVARDKETQIKDK